MTVPLSEWGQLAATGGLSFAIGIYGMKWIGNGAKWLIEFFTGRLDKKEAEVDAGMKELLDGLREQIKELKEECRELRERLSIAEHDLLECKKLHAEAETRAMQAEAVTIAKGEGAQHAALIIAAEKKQSKETKS